MGEPMNATQDCFDVGNDLAINKITRNFACTGRWVCGTICGHRFDALVFPDHADNRDWEIGDSRISKLWVERIADGRMTFNWDRGADVLAVDELTTAIIDFLAGGLADHIYHR